MSPPSMVPLSKPSLPPMKPIASGIMEEGDAVGAPVGFLVGETVGTLVEVGEKVESQVSTTSQSPP